MRPSPAAPGAARADAGGGARLALALSLSPRRCAAWLAGVAAGLVVLHVAVHVIHYQVEPLPWLFRCLFDLDEEQSFGTWYAALLLGAASGAALLCGQRAPGERLSWRLLGAGFVLLSIDEIAGLHETVNELTPYSWAIPGAILVLVVGACFVPFLLRLPRATARGLALAGALYVGGAVGVELATEPFAEADRLDTLAYSFATALEEGLEMAGAIAFLGVALQHAVAGAPRRAPRGASERAGAIASHAPAR